MKIQEIVHGEEQEIIGYAFMCPGCKQVHAVNTKQHGPTQVPVWEWNGENDTCTFTPSILVKYTWGPDKIEVVCHSFIKEGQIEYLSDCTHEFAGQTIPVPEWQGWDWDEYK